MSQAKGGDMKRALLLLLLLGVGTCVTSLAYAQDLINSALTALGGADALTQVKMLVVKGTVRYWEPEQSMVAGGEPRHAADATFEMTGDFTAHAVRVDWVKNFLYPSPRTFQFSEIMTPEAGDVIGIDSNGRNKQNRETTPPGHAMSGLRFTATQRELRRGVLVKRGQFMLPAFGTLGTFGGCHIPGPLQTDGLPLYSRTQSLASAMCLSTSRS